MAEQRTYTGGRFALDINGENAGFLKKFSGLAMEADIVSNDLGPDNVQKKHVSNIKWTPGKASIGIGMGNECYQWIKAAFDKGYVTKSGSLTSADFNYKAMSVQTFQNALDVKAVAASVESERQIFEIDEDGERAVAVGHEHLRMASGPARLAGRTVA